MRQELQEIKRHIYEDGSIAEGEVRLLSDLLARYGLGQDEMELLLDLNTILSGEPHPESFDTLFVDSLVKFMGEGGEGRWDWLKSRLFKDGALDALERRALAACAAQGMPVPEEMRAHL